MAQKAEAFVSSVLFYLRPDWYFLTLEVEDSSYSINGIENIFLPAEGSITWTALPLKIFWEHAASILHQKWIMKRRLCHKLKSWKWYKRVTHLSSLYFPSSFPEPASTPASCFLSNPSITARTVTLWGEKSACFLILIILGMVSLDAVKCLRRSEGQQRGRPVHWNCPTYNQPYSFLLICCHFPCTETDFWGGKSDVRSLGTAFTINSSSS